jgi:hypothetical protein
MMKKLKEDELEFISVSADEENEMNSAYVDPTAADSQGGSSTIGYWFFNQSKVINSNILLFT